MTSDIIDIHNETLNYLREQKKIFLEKYDIRMKEYQNIKIFNPKESKLVDDEMRKLNNKRKMKEDRISKYIEESLPILHEYKNFMSKNVIGQKNDELDSITEKYLEIVNKYKITRIEKTSRKQCEECKRPMEIVEESYFFCSRCNYYENYMNFDINIKKNSDARRKSFIDAILTVQGKENDIPKQEVIDQISKFIKERKISLKRKKDMRDILTSLKLTSYKSHANYIYSYMTGKSLIEIPKEIEDNVLKRYDIFMEVYDSIKKNRSNSIKNQHLLYYLLKMEGMTLDKDDFDLIKTKDSEIECNGIITRICEILSKTSTMKWVFER